MKRFHSAPLQQQLGQATLSVVLIYGIFAALWILFSDKAVEALFDDPAMIIRASMIKGWLFVAVTTGLLYVLVKRQIAHLNAAHRKEIASLQERQKSLDLLNAIVDNSDDAIFAKDSQGRYLLFNNAASRIVSKSAGEILGKDDREIFPPEQAKLLMTIGARVMANGQTETNEETLDTQLGRRVFLATKGPLRDTEQRIFGIFGISRDITERKLVEEELFKRNEELERFNRAMVGRELDMVELKQRINALSKELGREPPFDLAFLDAASDKDKASHGV
jgi:PAS domain S-box-containing protein